MTSATMKTADQNQGDYEAAAAGLPQFGGVVVLGVVIMVVSGVGLVMTSGLLLGCQIETSSQQEVARLFFWAEEGATRAIGQGP